MIHKTAVFVYILDFLKNFLELICDIYDTINSIPAKPLPVFSGKLNSGGFFFFGRGIL